MTGFSLSSNTKDPIDATPTHFGKRRHEFVSRDLLRQGRGFCPGRWNHFVDLNLPLVSVM